MRVGGEKGGTIARKGLVDVLHDDTRLADSLAAMDEHGHLLVHGVGRQEEVALVLEVLLDVVVAQVLEMERNPDPASPDTLPCAKYLQLTSGHFLSSARLVCDSVRTIARSLCLLVL